MKFTQFICSSKTVKNASKAGVMAAFMFMAIASTDEVETSAPPDSSQKNPLGNSVVCGNVEVTIKSVSERYQVGGEMFERPS